MFEHIWVKQFDIVWLKARYLSLTECILELGILIFTVSGILNIDSIVLNIAHWMALNNSMNYHTVSVPALKSERVYHEELDAAI